MERINIRISCELEQLSLLGMAVNGICKRFPEDIGWEIEISVIEAITNVIKYAYRYCPDKQIDLRLTLEDTQLEIVISDHGSPVDIASLVVSRNFDLKCESACTMQLEESGRGLGLIYNLMDTVVYHREAGINQLILTKSVPA